DRGGAASGGKRALAGIRDRERAQRVRLPRAAALSSDFRRGLVAGGGGNRDRRLSRCALQVARQGVQDARRSRRRPLFGVVAILWLKEGCGSEAGPAPDLR